MRKVTFTQTLWLALFFAASSSSPSTKLMHQLIRSRSSMTVRSIALQSNLGNVHSAFVFLFLLTYSEMTALATASALNCVCLLVSLVSFSLSPSIVLSPLLSGLLSSFSSPPAFACRGIYSSLTGDCFFFRSLLPLLVLVNLSFTYIKCANEGITQAESDKCTMRRLLQLPESKIITRRWWHEANYN